jgi:hypothetical protein
MTMGTCAVLLSSMSAQTVTRRASMVGGGGGQGRCTVEVVVDGAAEVEIRGDTAALRNLKGQTPQWRRFECNGAMPARPADFRFRGVDGRGRQTLVGDPRSGGPAVVRIEDPDNGMEGYTFEITWGDGGGYAPGPERRPDGDRGGRRFTTQQAVSACQDAVREQAGGRWRVRDVEFLRTTIDDQPGRSDWVVGTLAVRRMDRREIYRFSCSVNFDTGRVRSAQIQEVAERGEGERGAYGGGGRDRAMANCRRSVEDRVRGEGFDRVEFSRINVDDQPGRNDWIVGSVRLEARGRTEFRDFSCSVDMRDGDVRSVDVRRPR